MKKTLKTLFVYCYLLLGTVYYLQAQKPGFVYTEGEKFMLDGAPLYFSGTNVYDFFTYGSSSGDIETDFMDKDRIDAHMRRLYVNGVRVVRVWGFSHEDWHGFEPQKGVYSEGQFSLFDYVVKSAEANGVKLIIALENYWNDYGGIKDRLKWEGIEVAGGGTHDQGQFFTNASAVQGFKDYVKYFITRVNHYDGVEYRNDPTILAWELMNEPRYQGFGDDLASETLRAWVDEMGAFIKDLDSNHLLSSGLEAHGSKYGFGGDEGNDFIKIHQSPYMDFASAHPYIRESWSNFSLEETMTLICQWADESHKILNKPLYIGEFNVEIQERFEWWEEIYGFIEEKKIGASAFWWFPDNETPRDKFGVFEGDTEVAIYKEHALKMEKMSGGESIYLSLMSPKSGDKFASGSDVHIETNLINDNNTVTKVEFFSNGSLVGEDITAPYELDLSGLADGQYKITSVATGINGVTKESTPRNIQIGGEGILVLEYKDASTSVISNVIKPHLRLFNNSSQDISYSDISIRYWFETEEDLPLVFSTDYAVVGSNNVKGKFVKTEGNSYYLEVGFDPATGALGRNAGSGRIEAKIANSSFSDTNQANDYSFDDTKKEFAQSEKITLYLKGKLISGIEPGTAVDTPTAVIVASTTSGNGPLSVTFDASGSTDPNGDSLSYSWSFENGDAATGITTTYEFTEFGDQTVTLTVNDGNGNSDSETISIEVINPNIAPIAAFTTDVENGIAPVSITFDASTSTDANNDPLTYSWDFGNGDVATGIMTTYEFTAVGAFDVKLTVSDGELENSITKRIVVTDGNPIAKILANIISGIAPLEVSFDASGSVDPSNNVLTYTWDFGDGTTGIGESIVHTFNAVGSYTVTLQVDNNQGGVATDSIIIQVQEVLPVSDVVIEYKDGGNGSSSDNMVNPYIKIINSGASDIDYDDLTVRYWFTSEDNKNLNFWCDWAELGTSNVNGIFAEANGMDYFEISFDTAAGTLAASSNSGEIQTRFAKTNWSILNEVNDYSYDSSKISYTAHNTVTLYVNGVLVWGIEPAGAIRSQQEEEGIVKIVRSNDQPNNIIISPNPASSVLNVSIKNDIVKSDRTVNNVRIRLFNLMGNVVKVDNIKNKNQQFQVQIPVEDLASGIYLLEFFDLGSKKRTINKVIIK